MNTNVNTQAILLLTVWLSKSPKTDPKPLTPTEWGRFAQWMKEQGKTPVGLLENRSVADYLQGCPDTKITPERVEFLLGRSMAFSLVLEKWQRAGLWILTRSDPDYPSRLKTQLKADAPPVLFGCGNRKLLDKGGIAMVGSRDVTPDQLALTETLAGTFAMQGFSIVSGGARGVDETAMLGALEKEGTVIGILADSLLRTATSAKYRSGLMSKNLVLVSPFNPEAGFDVGNAMARNKYIYSLSDAAIVVSTGKGSGGTWSGAVENLKKGWTPLWVCQNPDSSSGNSALVQQGARWLPEMPLDAASLLKAPSVSIPAPPLEATLFDILDTPMQDVTVAESVEHSGYAQEKCKKGITQMEYQIGKPGRIAVVRFSDGDDVLGGIAKICRTEDIRAACFNVVGGMKGGRFVVGPEREDMPPKPVWRELQESHEAVGFGTIFWEKDQPKVHFHGAFGKWDSVKVGCLREVSEAFLVLEVVITEILDVNIIRELDSASAMVLIKMNS